MTAMREGLLWYDNDPRASWEEKVKRAMSRYREKFGREPTTCFVNPATLADNAGAEGPLHLTLGKTTVRILPARNILLHHFWVGRPNDEGESSSLAGGRTRRLAGEE